MMSLHFGYIIPTDIIQYRIKLYLEPCWALIDIDSVDDNVMMSSSIPLSSGHMSKCTVHNQATNTLYRDKFKRWRPAGDSGDLQILLKAADSQVQKRMSGPEKQWYSLRYFFFIKIRKSQMHVRKNLFTAIKVVELSASQPS